MAEMTGIDMARVQDTIRARLVLVREDIAERLEGLRSLVADGICAGLTTGDLSERSGLDADQIEIIRSGLV